MMNIYPGLVGRPGTLQRELPRAVEAIDPDGNGRYTDLVLLVLC